jgi:hypothetical protein
MPSPIVVRISHALGKAEATRRIEDGFGKANAILPNVVRIEKSGGGDRPLSLAGVRVCKSGVSSAPAEVKNAPATEATTRAGLSNSLMLS